MQRNKGIVLGVLFLLLIFGSSAVGLKLGENISMKAGPTLPGEELALVWVETVLSPRNLGRGEKLLLLAHLASGVSNVYAVFDSGQKVPLLSDNGLTWKAVCKLADDTPLGLQTVRFEIVGENGKKISRNLDFFVNLGEEIFSDTSSVTWPMEVLKTGKVVLLNKKGRISDWKNIALVSEGEEVQGISKTLWYKVQLKDGQQGWIDAAYVKEPVADYQVCAYEYYKVKDYASAAQYCRRALRIDPKFVKARFWLAKSLLKLGQEDAALDELAKVFEIDPQNKEARLLAAALLKRYLAAANYDYKTEKYQEAVAGYSRVVRLDPGNTQAYLALGKSYQAIGEQAKAREAWQQALSLEPNNETAQALLAGEILAVAVVDKNMGRGFAGDSSKADKGEYIVLVKDGKTHRGTKINQALKSVLSMSKSLGTKVLERGWSVKPAKDGYRVAFLCEYNQQGKDRKMAVETFEWKVDAATQKITPNNKNAKLLMARW